jgi:hypothetical protein
MTPVLDMYPGASLLEEFLTPWAYKINPSPFTISRLLFRNSVPSVYLW